MKVIIDSRIKTAVPFKDALHVFLASRGTGTAIVELNMGQENYSIDQNPLFLVLLELRQSYDTLDHSQLF